MPPTEVGEAYVAIRAIATDFRAQAESEVNAALTQVRERATVAIRAQVDTTSANRVQQSFQPVVAGARQMGSEVERSYGAVGSSSHHAYERVQLSHDGIRARFGETLRAASAMGGGIALAYGAFSQGRAAIQVTNELAHETNILMQATGLSAHAASAWISVAQSQGISATQLRTGFNGLSRATASAENAFAKAGASAQQNLGRIHAEQIRVTADTVAYRAALDKYGQGSTQAASASATLASAQNTLKGYVDKTTGSVSGAAGAFDQLGITSAQLKSVQGDLPAELDLIANKFQSMGAGTDRATIAQQLFGRGSSVLIPILAQGAAGIQKNIDIATQYGATLSGPTLKSMEELRVEQQHLSLEMTGLRVRIATAVEPALISLAGFAVRTASTVGNILGGSFRIARKAADDFLKTPFGQGLSTIASDASRFAAQVRTKFERDLSKPLSFGRLFDNFTRDLEHWLPSAAKAFWTQLNQDLFAPGKLVEIPLKVKPKVDLSLDHVPSLLGSLRRQETIPVRAQLVGAGIFPGSGFETQGKRLGEAILSGLEAGITQGKSAIHTVEVWLGEIVTWITTGGGAAKLISGGLQIADALVQAIFDPKVWIANWRPILDLALVFFSDGLTSVGKGAAKDMLAAITDRLLNVRWIGEVVAAFRALPIALASTFRDALAAARDYAEANFGRIGQLIVRLITGGLALLPTAVRGLARLALGGFEDVLTAIKGTLENIFEVGFLAEIFLKMVRFAAKTVIGDAIVGLGRNIVVGFINGVTGAAGWAEKQISHFFHEFIGWVEGILGISSPSTVAKRWGADIVNGLVSGLRSLPGAVLRLISRLPGLFVTVIRDIVRAEIAGWSIVLGAARALGERLVTGAISEARKLPGQIRDVITSAGRRISSLNTWLFNEAKSLGVRLVKGVISGAGSLAGDLKSSLESHIKGALSSLNPFSPIEHGVDIYIAQPIIKGTTAALDPYQRQLQAAIVPPLRQVLSNAHDDQAVPGGRSIGTGVTQGVRAGLGSLQATMTSAIVAASKGAITASKHALGISSPSKLYADEIGRPLADGIIQGMGGLEKGLVAKVTAAARAATAVTAGGGGSTPTGTAATGANQALGRQMMLAHGWPASQWGALQALWTRESGWNQYAKNASSGAYGIPQSLPASKMASAGADYLTNPATQIRWGLDYIAARYGSPGGAWAHEGQYGWYHRGGVVPGGPTENVPIIAQGGEVVFRPDQLAALKGLGGITIHQLTITGSNGRELADDFLNEIANRTRA